MLLGACAIWAIYTLFAWTTSGVVAAPTERSSPRQQSSSFSQDGAERLQRRAMPRGFSNPIIGILTTRWGYGGCTKDQISDIDASLGKVQTRTSAAAQDFSPGGVLPGGMQWTSPALRAITGQLRVPDRTTIADRFDAISQVTRTLPVLLDDRRPLLRAGPGSRPWIIIACITAVTPTGFRPEYGVDRTGSLLGEVHTDAAAFRTRFAELRRIPPTKFTPVGLPLIEWLSLFPRHFLAKDSAAQFSQDAKNLEEALFAGPNTRNLLTQETMLSPAQTILHELFHSPSLFGRFALVDCLNGCTLQAVLTQSGTLGNNLKLMDAENQALLAFFLNMSPSSVRYIDQRLNIHPACIYRRSGSTSSGCSGQPAPVNPPVRPTTKQVLKSNVPPVQAISGKSLAAPAIAAGAIKSGPQGSSLSPLNTRPRSSAGQAGGKIVTGAVNLQAAGMVRTRVQSKL